MSRRPPFLILCIAATLSGGYAASAATETPAAKAEAVQPPPATTSAAEKSTAPGAIKGKVAETMKAGGYTYILVENSERKEWVAVPPVEVKVGDEVEIGGGMEMRNFTSRSLNRTFESIFFTGGLVSGGRAPAAPAQPAAARGMNASMPSGHPAAGSANGGATAASAASAGVEKPTAPVAGKIVETMDGGGYTYAALEKEGQRTWVAVPAMKLEIGQQVEFNPGMVMTNFRSKALNRTFESIVFSSGVIAPK